MNYGKIKFLIFLLVFFSCEEYKKKDSNLDQTHTNNNLLTPKKDKKKEGYLWVDGIRYNLKKIDYYKAFIQRYSTLNNLDWRLIVAMILKESSFDEKAVSRVGARGLMQIMPITKEELSERLDIEYIYERPKENIKAGIYHLAEQFRFFPKIEDELLRSKIAVASYNCGAGRLLDAIYISKHEFGKELTWERVVWALERLKKRNYKLHLSVWAEGKPKRGYFNNPLETVSYVERIWKIYDALKKILKK